MSPYWIFPLEFREKLLKVRKTTEQTTAGIRNYTRELWPPALYDFGLFVAIRKLLLVFIDRSISLIQSKFWGKNSYYRQIWNSVCSVLFKTRYEPGTLFIRLRKSVWRPEITARGLRCRRTGIKIWREIGSGSMGCENGLNYLASDWIFNLDWAKAHKSEQYFL